MTTVLEPLAINLGFWIEFSTFCTEKTFLALSLDFFLSVEGWHYLRHVMHLAMSLMMKNFDFCTKGLGINMVLQKAK